MSDPTPKQEPPYGLRMPPSLKARVKAAAEANNRSMNAEIIAALEERYPAPQTGDVLQRGVHALFEDNGWTISSNDYSEYGIDIFANRGAMSAAVKCVLALDQLLEKSVEEIAASRPFIGANASVIVGYGTPRSGTGRLAEELGIILLNLEKTPDFPKLLIKLHPFRKVHDDEKRRNSSNAP